MTQENCQDTDVTNDEEDLKNEENLKNKKTTSKIKSTQELNMHRLKSFSRVPDWIISFN